MEEISLDNVCVKIPHEKQTRKNLSQVQGLNQQNGGGEGGVDK